MSLYLEKALRAGKFLLLLLASLRLGAPSLTGAESAASLEYKVKAGYLFNFARFVEWPAAALPTANAPLVIGILDNGDAHPIIGPVLTGKKVDGHPLAVKAVSTDELQGVHILFITRAAGKVLEAVNEKLRDRSTLLVGETDGFAERGGMVGFQLENDSIRLQLNLERATAAGLKVSSQLFSVARVVKSGKASH